MSIEREQLRKILEGALLGAGHPLTLARLQSLFEHDEKFLAVRAKEARDNEAQGTEAASEEEPEEAATPGVPEKDEILAALQDIQADCENRGFELKEVASGWRFQVRAEMAPWVNRLWEEKPQKYSRALLETLSLIAYRQPITRGDIEEIRGVAVSSHIIKTLSERDWIKVIGHRDVPGRPSLYATTRQFLDYFNIKNLEDLPSLGEIRDLEELNKELDLGIEAQISASAEAGAEAGEQAASEEAAESALELEPSNDDGDADTQTPGDMESEPEHETVADDGSSDGEQGADATENEVELIDEQQEEAPDPDFDDTFESAPASQEQNGA